MSEQTIITEPAELDILALIPARGGSKGVPNKNIRDVAGKPLIAYSIETAEQSGYIDRTIVSTDSEEIAAVARGYDAEVPFLRPAEYAQDLTPDYPVFEHCLDWLQENENYEPDIIVHLRPTGPLRTADEVDESIEKFQQYPNADSLRSVQPVSKNPYKMWEIDGDYLTPFLKHPEIDEAYNAPRQSLPEVLETTSDIGLCRRETIIKKKSILGDQILPYTIDRLTVDIDTLTELWLAEHMIVSEDLSSSKKSSKLRPAVCEFCGTTRFELIHTYDSPLEQEPNYEFASTNDYYREVWKCECCNHMYLIPEFGYDIERIYQDDYMESNYGSVEEIHSKFSTIMDLPKSESNNYHRVKNVNRFINNRSEDINREWTLYDIGTSLGVFPAQMKEKGWECTILDPDSRAVKHAREYIGIDAQEGLLTPDTEVDTQYDLVSLIKVLEHNPDPIELLKLGKQFVNDDGYIYIEVPDGLTAAKSGYQRMEFNSTHFHAFSPISVSMLAESAGLELLEFERVYEPSGKYTLRAFFA